MNKKNYVNLLKNSESRQHPAGHHMVESESEVRRLGMEFISIQYLFFLKFLLLLLFRLSSSRKTLST